MEIPYEWLSTPLQRRPTDVVNSAAITQFGAATAYSTDAASIAQYGVGKATATLTTAVDADALNLATHLTTYYDTPRPRQPVLAFNLFSRTEAECELLLSVGLARRVRLVHTPDTWPPGAANFVVEGIRHTIAVDQRIVGWATSALVGTGTSEPGPWFRWDSSSWDGSDLRPF